MIDRDGNPMCLYCASIKARSTYNVQEIGDVKIYGDCKAEVYCERTMRTIAKGKNKTLHLKCPRWCPKRNLK